ncbi:MULTISPECIES: exosortase-associated protein EpsI, B-type [unclassified Janthinobacterium]|uniref:exosortase-associated protein EpsI, B-type n=1 Tax=unclassified Janthinobacterium TaxID=2610881 RepID=UPI0003493639|nr:MULTISPECIES: exosortase-associated protein EpsI, B-type [unclassified Janthinobacterium]MEC5163524.1 EpsI family protein [Janthinobacterium sp. CG_S6]
MMKKITLSLVLGALMVSSALATHVLSPTQKVVDLHDRIDLASMIPAAFGEWKIDSSIMPVQVDPELQRRLDAIYNQTLSRTYINPQGQRVMLSMAYGGDQTGSLEMHRPDQCYGAQGFEISNIRRDKMASPFGSFALTRLIAATDGRHEPISYWMTVGDRAVKDGLEQKIQKFRYMLTGKIPDGMLVRVSTINQDDAEAFRQQDRFVNDLLGVLGAKDRVRLIGSVDAAQDKH